MCPLQSQRTKAGSINGPRASLRASEYTLLLEVSKQDLEGAWTSAESSAPCSPALCPCVDPALRLDHSQAQGTSLSASPVSPKDIRMPEHCPVCRTSGTGCGFSKTDPLHSPKDPYTTICKSHSISKNFKEWRSYGQGGDYPTQHKLQPAPLGHSRAKGSNRSCPAQLEQINHFTTTR